MMSPYDIDMSTTIKTPTYYGEKSTKPSGEFYDQNDSQIKSKTGAGLYDQSQVSPISHKLSIFTATANSHQYRAGNTNQNHLA